MRRVYLAGPDVFYEHAAAHARDRQALCARYGFAGLDPLDSDVSGDALSTQIFHANVALIRTCDAVIAHLTPFRGASADAGTVFEIGYAAALGKPVFAYADVAESYAARVAALHGPLREADGRLFARDGMCVEDFGLIDNLMIVESVHAQGWDIVVAPAHEGFEECLRRAAAHFSA